MSCPATQYGDKKMTVLKKLVLSNHTQQRAKVDPVIRSRTKLIAALQQQISIVESELKGETFTVERLRWKTNAEGVREKVPARIAPRAWYWEEDDTVYLMPKIGVRPLEIEKEKPTIKIGNKAELVSTLKMLTDAVESGELDKQIAATNNQTRPAM